MKKEQVGALLSTTLILSDALMVALAFAVSYWLRANIPLPTLPLRVEPLTTYLPMMLTQVLSVIIVFYFYRLYHMRRVTSRIDLAYSVFAGVSIGTMMSVALASLLFKNSIFELDYPRGMVIYSWVLSIVFVMFGREIHRQLTLWLRRRGIAQDRVLIVGTGEIARAIIQKIQWSPNLGYQIVGAVNGNTGDELVGVPILGKINDLPRVIDEHQVDEVIIALPEIDRRELVHLITMCQRGSTNVKVFPDVFEIMAGDITIDDLAGLPLLSVRDVALRGWKLSLKRALDLVGAVVGLTLLSPFMLLTAILIKLESPGPAFYCQERMGLDGKPFMMIKFRSMRADAEKNGPGWTVKDDPRRTKIGAWMRKVNWDEIPQLINVLLGEMSLVGPRPERPVYVQRFRQSIPRYMERHREKAGMTGWAQVNGLRGNSSIVERTKYDLWYIENWSIWLDIKIIIRTIIQTITRRNPHAY